MLGRISVDWYEEFISYYAPWPRGNAEERSRFFRAYLHDGNEWKEENLKVVESRDDLVNFIAGLSGFSVEDVDNIFTQQNGKEFFRGYRFNFSDAVNLRDGRKRQSYLFTYQELCDFKNSLRTVLGRVVRG